MSILIMLYVFIVGLCMGSFALAVADRTKFKKNWVSDRSECEKCGHKLGVVDLIPVLSWVSTKGHCRYCRVKLSALYPVSELLMGSVFVLSYLKFNNESGSMSWVQLSLWLAGLVLMQILLFIDLRTFTLPYKFLFPLIAVSAVFAVLSILDQESLDLSSIGIALAVGVGPFLVLYLLSAGKWIGDSDVLFGLAMAFFLMNGLEVWLAIVTASIAGLAYSYIFIIRKTKKYKKIKIPFGPFLIFGLVLTFLYGATIIDWYISNLLFI